MRAGTRAFRELHNAGGDARSESYTMRAGTRAFRELQNAGEDARVPNLLHEQLQIRLVKDWYAG